MAVSTRLNTAVFAPIPSVSVATATPENPGALRNILTANLKSDHMLLIYVPSAPGFAKYPHTVSVHAA